MFAWDMRRMWYEACYRCSTMCVWKAFWFELLDLKKWKSFVEYTVTTLVSLHCVHCASELKIGTSPIKQQGLSSLFSSNEYHLSWEWVSIRKIMQVVPTKRLNIVISVSYSKTDNGKVD